MHSPPHPPFTERPDQPYPSTSAAIPPLQLPLALPRDLRLFLGELPESESVELVRYEPSGDLDGSLEAASRSASWACRCVDCVRQGLLARSHDDFVAGSDL